MADEDSGVIEDHEDAEDEAPVAPTPPLNLVAQASVGRIVHYVLPASSRYAGQHRAAVIAQVWQPIGFSGASGMSNLAVFKGQSHDFSGVHGLIAGHSIENSTAIVGSVLYSEKGDPGTWHWPERT